MRGSARDFVYFDRIWGRRLTEEQAIMFMPRPDPIAGWVPMSEWLLVREDVELFVDKPELQTFCASYNIDLISSTYAPSKTLVYCLGCSKLCLNTRSFLLEHCDEAMHLKVLSETHKDKEEWPAALLGPSGRVPVSREFEEERVRRERDVRPGEEELWMEMEVAGGKAGIGRPGVERNVDGREEDGEMWMGIEGAGVLGNGNGGVRVGLPLEGGQGQGVVKATARDADILVAAIKRIQLK